MQKLKNDRGEISIYTVVLILIINLVIALIVYYYSVYMDAEGIRNGMTMQLNNLSAQIAEDTYAAARESVLEAYLQKLCSSANYQRKLTYTYREGLAKKVPLETSRYALKNMRLSFREEEGQITYTISCDAQFFIRALGKDYPTVLQTITLSGSHQTKY